MGALLIIQGHFTSVNCANLSPGTGKEAGGWAKAGEKWSWISRSRGTRFTTANHKMFPGQT